ncbi:hypothetical protein BDF19DRAFT_123156 [Syncephalis fuscata]|nr:hypothetical protein BDF19DRAFT_123156 [Syncephalis fuscata]
MHIAAGQLAVFSNLGHAALIEWFNPSTPSIIWLILIKRSLTVTFNIIVMLFQPLCHIYGFFLIALYYPQLVSALVTFKVDNQTYNYSTQDPFGVKLEAYFSNGILVMPEFDAEAPCTLVTQSRIYRTVHQHSTQWIC